MINYIIPIKDDKLIYDKHQFVRLLSRTIRSIVEQDRPNKIYIAASSGTSLPELPHTAEVVEVPSAENNILAARDQDHFYRLVRKDKGSRILAAIRKIESPDDYIMVVDDDDLIHHNLAGYAIDNKLPGYVVNSGYMHHIEDGTFYRMDRFNAACGTSLIVKKELYLYRSTLSPEEMGAAINDLGSHLILPGRQKSQGKTLAEIPFRAAIYCTGNRNSTQRIIGEKFGVRRAADLSKAEIAMVATPDDMSYIKNGFPALATCWDD